MGKLVGLIVVACFILVTASWFAPRMAARQAMATDVAAAPGDAEPGKPTAGGAASVPRAADGHYWAQATVDGRAVTFLVDTGASTVALTQADARRLGLQPERLNYSVPIRTASGQAWAAPVTLRSVAVSNARVADVEALVAREGLEVSLLGMSYLGRLSRFEATPRALILRP